MHTNPPEPPTVGAFYQHRKGVYIAQVVSVKPHTSLGYLVDLRSFHGPYARRLTLNPKLFAGLFEHVSIDEGEPPV